MNDVSAMNIVDYTIPLNFLVSIKFLKSRAIFGRSTDPTLAIYGMELYFVVHLKIEKKKLNIS